MIFAKKTKKQNKKKTILLKNDYETMILLCIQHIMKENLLLLKDLLES